MKKKRIIITIVQIVVALFAVILLTKAGNDKVAPTTALVFSQDLEKGHIIEQNDVQTITVPRAALNDTFAFDANEMLGKELKSHVFKGNYVYKSQYGDEEEKQAEITGIDWSKYRIYEISTGAVNPRIRRGSKVDLVFTGEGEANEDKNGSGPIIYSKVFMQDVQVIGTQFDALSDEDIEKMGVAGETRGTVLLALTLEEIEEIQARQRIGTITMVERSQSAESYDTPGFTVGNYKKRVLGEGDAETKRITKSNNIFRTEKK